MIPLLKQLLFGWDTSIGVWAFVVTSLAFGEQANVWFLLFAGFCAYLPDLDFILFLALRRRQGVTVGHWVYGHYPLLVLPLEALIVKVVASRAFPGHGAFPVTLAVMCTLGHFLHDTAARPNGFHLLAPLTKKWRIQFPVPWTHVHPRDLYHHYRIGWGSLISKAPPDQVQRLYDECEQWTKSGGSEIAGRVEPVTTAQLVAFLVGMLGLVFLVMTHGWTWPF